MGWFRMPLNVWALYATALIQVLATPVLGITLLLLIIERFLHIGIFDPTMGGDPVLFQHFFWFYSHPAVYIMILPGDGRHLRDHHGPLAQAHLRLQGHRATRRWPSRSSRSWSGATTCSCRVSRAGRHRVLAS
jgi:hypothetical protein